MTIMEKNYLQEEGLVEHKKKRKGILLVQSFTEGGQRGNGEGTGCEKLNRDRI